MKDNTRSANDTYQEAIDYLKLFRPDGPWLLTAIIPDGKTKTITARDAAAVRRFIAKYNGQQNLHYSVNPTRAPMFKKAAKTDIARIEYIHADLDPKETEPSAVAKARYLEALKSFQPPATATVDSGNGIQALWKLADPIVLGEPVLVKKERMVRDKLVVEEELEYSDEDATKIAEVEACSAAVMKALGCDDTGTKDISRILRVPGTTNLPNKSKIKAGRTVTSSKQIHFNGATYTLEDFSAAAPTPPTDPTPADLDYLKADLDYLKAESGGLGRYTDPFPPPTDERIKAALNAIDPDIHRPDWIKIGYALYDERGDEKGFAFFNAWSSKGEKYDASKIEADWRSIVKGSHSGKKITIATLFHYASEADPDWQQDIEPKPDQKDARALVPSEGLYPLIIELAIKLWGEPTAHVGYEYRFGTDRSKAVNARSGMWVDFAAGTGGGVNNLIMLMSSIEATPRDIVKATPFEWIDPTKIPRRQWLYRPHYIREFLSLVFAIGGMGKSSLLMVEALAMVTGKTLLNVVPEKKLRVWYWNGEDPKLELQRRFAAAMKHYGIKPEDIGDRLFIDSGRTLPIVIAEEAKYGGTFICEPLIEDVIATLRENQDRCLDYRSFYLGPSRFRE